MFSEMSKEESVFIFVRLKTFNCFWFPWEFKREGGLQYLKTLYHRKGPSYFPTEPIKTKDRSETIEGERPNCYKYQNITGDLLTEEIYMDDCECNR